jgi:hypothetical protein
MRVIYLIEEPKTLGHQFQWNFLPQIQVTYSLGLASPLPQYALWKRTEVDKQLCVLPVRDMSNFPIILLIQVDTALFSNLSPTQRRNIPRDIFLEKNIVIEQLLHTQKRNRFSKNKLKGKWAGKVLCFVSTRNRTVVACMAPACRIGMCGCRLIGEGVL